MSSRRKYRGSNKVDPPGGGRRSAPAARPGAQVGAADKPFLLALVIAAVLVYANTLSGQFVYDDLRQIVRNTLIQDGSQFWRALFSDVWAFKGGAGPASNYWRPSFVLWLIANFNAFGAEHPFGWHVTSILLHGVVVALAFVLTLRLGAARHVAAAAALLFAVHPAHVESVAWISGSPDLILAAALLGSLGFVLSLAEHATPARWAWALGLYALALGAKETAIFYPAVVVAVLLAGPTGSGQRGLPPRQALRIAAPFAVLAALYFLARLAVLGVVTRAYHEGAGAVDALLSAPAVFTFYLRQVFFPLWVGPSYPLRAVSAPSLGLANFALPLAISLAVLVGMCWVAARSRVALAGLVLFLLPLAPAFNIVAFQPEQLVHDRYLYLPLLGLLLWSLAAVAALLERAGLSADRASRALLAGAVLAAVPLSAQTLVYNQAWLDELALWRRGVVSDPTSAFNQMQYAFALDAAQRYDEARAAFDRSLAIRPIPNAYVGRGRVALAQKRFVEAEGDLLHMIDDHARSAVDAYTLYQGYEALAVCYERQGRLPDAAARLVEARANLPMYAAALTEKLAVILYQGGQKAQALAELEAQRAAALVEPLPESKEVWLRLGLLYVELGRHDEARAALQGYLEVTATLDNPATRAARTQAQAALHALRP